MHVQLHSDVAGHQLLIDFMDVDEKYSNSFSSSYKIFQKLMEIIDDEILSSTMQEREESFVGFICTKKTHIVVCGYHARGLVTVDVRMPSEIDSKEIIDWLVHEYRPSQIIKRMTNRGDTSKEVQTDTIRIRTH
jgi:S-adenosylmethionine/arginine decarboxylase-like enzyme